MRSHRQSLSIIAAGAAAALVLGACSSDDNADNGTEDSGAESGAYPVTISHAFGETEIDAEPERIVTWGWAAADAVVALGETPVGIPAQSYGGDENGVLPWVGDALNELGTYDDVTVIPSDSTEAPIEDIAALEPDLILAPYSGVTEEEYELLSQIADTVAYPETAWATPWRDVISITGQALGQPDEAAEILDAIDQEIASHAEENPDFEGVSIAQLWAVGGEVYVYLPADPRVEFTEALGFATDPSVTDLDTGESTFFYTLSPELLDQLAADLVILYGDTQEEIDAFVESTEGQLIPAVQAGAVASVVGQAEIASVSPPTALSLSWGIEDYVADLAAAVDGL